MSKESHSGVLKAAGAMGAATFLSRIMGLVREQVFAILFGAGNATDAFNVAFRIPNLLRDLFAEGAMSASLVPTFTRAREEEGDRRAWRVAGLVFRVLFALVSFIAVFGVVFAPWLVDAYASAYRNVEGKFELTVLLTRIMFPFFPLVALAAAFMGILNACGYFFLPAFASALFNLGSIVVGATLSLIFIHLQGQGQVRGPGGQPIPPIVGMAIGVVVGGAVQALCQLPSLRRAGYRWPGKEASDPPWHKDVALKQMLWMLIPGTVGLAATQVNILVNTILATSQGTGAVSWLNYAFRLMQFPIGIFGVSLASATLPVVSRQWVNRDTAGVSQTISQSLKQVFAINLPASAGLAFLGVPIIRMIFEYGRFTSHDTQNTALALAIYAIGLTAYSAVKVLVPVFYALGNTRIPVISSFVSVGAAIILNLILVGPFKFAGLALGTSLAAFLNSGFLLVALRRLLAERGVSFGVRPILGAFFQYALVGVFMGAVCYGSSRGWDRLWPEAVMHGSASRLAILRVIKVSVLVGEGIVLTVLLAKVFRLKDLTQVIDLFESRLKKKLRLGK